MIIFKAKWKRVKVMKTETQVILSTKDKIDPAVLEQVEGAQGFAAFSLDEYKKSVEEKMKDRSIGINEKGQTPSQLLRGDIAQAYLAAGSPGDFDYFYRKTINYFRKQVTDRINEIK